GQRQSQLDTGGGRDHEGGREMGRRARQRLQGHAATSGKKQDSGGRQPGLCRWLSALDTVRENVLSALLDRRRESHRLFLPGGYRSAAPDSAAEIEGNALAPPFQSDSSDLSARAKLTSGFSESFRSGIVTSPKIRTP